MQRIIILAICLLCSGLMHGAELRPVEANVTMKMVRQRPTRFFQTPLIKSLLAKRWMT